MTDNEIIKALEHNANKCRFYEDSERQGLYKSTLDLINRQKADIERLKKELMKCKLEKEMLYNVGVEIQTIAIKEFAERLKHFIIPQKADGYTREIVLKRDIDNLIKEMTEVEINQRKEDEGK